MNHQLIKGKPSNKVGSTNKIIRYAFLFDDSGVWPNLCAPRLFTRYLLGYYLPSTHVSGNSAHQSQSRLRKNHLVFFFLPQLEFELEASTTSSTTRSHTQVQGQIHFHDQKSKKLNIEKDMTDKERIKQDLNNQTITS